MWVLDRLRNIPVISEKQILRFWTNVQLKADLDKCWKWLRTKDEAGYGMVNLNYVTYRSHRVAFFIHNAIDPIGKFVCHSCDNTSCCNPNHLFLGTPADNFDDMEIKGRNFIPVAENNGMSKLSNGNVLKIREIFANGNISRRQLAELYNIDYSTMCKILKNKAWLSLK